MMDLLDHKGHKGEMGIMRKLEGLVHLEMMERQEPNRRAIGREAFVERSGSGRPSPAA